MKFKPGDKFKVKTTPITRAHGTRVHNYDGRHNKAWPGEVGVVVRREWKAATTGEDMHGHWLEFSQGRSVCIDSFDEKEWAEYLRVKA